VVAGAPKPAGVAPPAEPTAAPAPAGAVAARRTDPEEAFPEEEIPGNAGANPLPRTSVPAATSSSAATPGATQLEPAAAGPATTAPGPPAPARGSGGDSAQTAALRKQLEAPVASGYALHVWSFPDSLEAAAASAPLVRQGLSPAVRGALIQQRRWYRVVVGNFASRAEAMAARALLAGQPGIEYVGVVRVQQ
jgi:septal ring-binding cell division protein DamX